MYLPQTAFIKTNNERVYVYGKSLEVVVNEDLDRLQEPHSLLRDTGSALIFVWSNAWPLIARCLLP